MEKAKKKAQKAAQQRAWRKANPARNAATNRAAGRRWREANPDKVRERAKAKSPEKVRASNLKKNYGISLEQFAAMHAAQQGRCAVCGNEIAPRGKSTHVDHDHTTGKVRALLCHACNTGLGLFKDSADRLLLAAKYVLFHKAT